MEREQMTIQIGLRVPERVNNRLDEKAESIGISKNALLMVLIDMGMKVYEGTVQIIPPQE